MPPLISQDASLKTFNALLRDFRPELMLAAKFTSDSGYYTEIAQLYSTMFHEWSALQKDVSDTMEAVSSLEWSVAPYADTGEKPSDKAQDAADTVRRAIWHTAGQAPGTYAHSFVELTGAMLDAIYRGASVHEIIWQRSADLVYPAEFRQVAPQHYVWETRSGHEDRLLMVRDGMSYSDAEPFPAHKFIIALNTVGSDHPIYNAVFYSLIGYFVAAKFGLPWLQQYCKRYGHPVMKFNVNTEEDIAKLKRQLKESDDLYSVFLLNEGDMDVTAMPSGASIPHETLLRVAENACHQAILGQTLTSDTSQNGGSRAQAEVHMGVQKSIVMKRAEYVARVLNRQLVPAIIAMNYGAAASVPMPEIKFSLPDDSASIERAEFWGKVLALPGVTVPRETVYESLRIPIPAEGDDTLGGSPATPQGEQEEDVKKKGYELGVKGAHCNQWGHVLGCLIGADGRRVYTIPPGREKALPGNMALYSGYEVNELGHGELADLPALADFLDSPPVGRVADGFFPREGVKAKELAAHIAAVYQKAGVGSLHVEPVGEVLLDKKGILNSIGHFSQNKKTTPEHKQRVTDAFALVPAVLQKGALVEYGQQKDNQNLRSYIYLAPVQIGKEKCVMAVRIRSSQGQQARFYLHGVALADELKEKAPKKSRIQGSGLDTGTPSGADHRDVFRVAKKAYRVKQKNGEKLQSARRGTHGSAGELLAELTMREYLRPLAAALREAKESGESYAAIKKRLATPLTNAAALSHGLAAAFNAGRSLPQDDTIAAANPYGCNQYGEGWSSPHDGNSTGYQQMGPGKPKRKVLTTEHGGNKVEKVTHEKHPGKGAYEHADNDALDKAAKEEREKREREKLTAATARTPEELLKATGLPREGEATTEQVESFLNAMRNRYPENAKRFDELVSNVKTTIPGKAGREAVEHIREQLQGYMCMISPEVLDQLPQTRIEQMAQRLLQGNNGTCRIDSSLIQYKKGVSNETIIHEYTHLLHNSCSDETFEKIANYYRERTDGEPLGKLKLAGKGKSDHFAPSFNPMDDYAGRIYDHELTKQGRTTKEGVVKRSVKMSNGVGTEMVTRHLQKMALSSTDFQRYWNDKIDGKYLWREAFLVSMNLLCNK